jgi:hypothetical protein
VPSEISLAVSDDNLADTPEQPKTPQFAVPDLPLKRLHQLAEEQPSTSKEPRIIEEEIVSF